MFHRFCFCLCLWRLVEGLPFHLYQVLEGDSVTLSSDLTELKNEDQIEWRFGHEDNLIAEINVTANRFSVHDDVLDGRFRDRLKLDNKTGSLTITDIRIEDREGFILQTNQMCKMVGLSDDTQVELEGVTLTLRSRLTKLKNDDQIQWRFGHEDTLIAEINKQTNRFFVFDDVLDGRFRDRLKLDNKTGSLTITDIRTEHSGDYKQQTNNETNFVQVSVSGKKENVSVKMRNSVTLSSGVSELKNDDLIQWRFGEDETLIAEINKQTNRFSVFDDVLDGIFRDRLKLDKKTGSLTITDTRTEHAGDYKFQLSTNDVHISFDLIVCDEISVQEGDSVTLSSGFMENTYFDMIIWMFGKEQTLIAKTLKQFVSNSVFVNNLDKRFSDRLKLDNITGSLTITDTRAEHAGVYERWSPEGKIHFFLTVDSVHCCGPTEAIIGLVVFALVGVATVIIVLYCIRSRRAEQYQAHILASQT